MNEDDEQHQAAFGEHTGLSDQCRFMINDIKSNSINVDKLLLNRLIGSVELSDLAWKLLGRYIANNTHLKTISLRLCNISNEQMALLFSELVESRSLHHVDLGMNEFGIDGLRNMIPLLHNSQLKELYFSSNNNFDTECIEVLLSALHERPVEKLHFLKCNITVISALETYYLPNLQRLTLNDNKIGRDGCRILSSVLQKEDTSLKYLYLDNTGIDNDGAEILATSLKHNTTLHSLELIDNDIEERGKGAFLKILLDASSIENMYNSNHTLTSLLFAFYSVRPRDETGRQIELAIHMNKLHQSSRAAAGRAKVINYQLNSQRRKELCHLQGVEYTSIGNLFADIESFLFPNILALIGIEHGRSEFYTALIPMVPGLDMSYIDRRALIDNAIAKNSKDIADLEAEYARRKLALTKKRDELHKRRACIESEADIQRKDEGEQKLTSFVGKKRRIRI